MNKFKLLIPIIGITTLVGLVTPMTSCNIKFDPTVAEHDVFLNGLEPGAEVKIDKSEAIEGEDFFAGITFTAISSKHFKITKVTNGDQDLEKGEDWSWTLNSSTTASISVNGKSINDNISIYFEYVTQVNVTLTGNTSLSVTIDKNTATPGEEFDGTITFRESGGDFDIVQVENGGHILEPNTQWKWDIPHSTNPSGTATIWIYSGLYDDIIIHYLYS